MLNPLRLRRFIDIETLMALRPHVLKERCNPVNTHLGGAWEVRRRGLWPHQHQEVWELADHEAQIGYRACRPLIAQPFSDRSLNVDLIKRPSERIETRGIHNDIKLELSVARFHALGCNTNNRCLDRIDEFNIGTVVSFEVVSFKG